MNEMTLTFKSRLENEAFARTSAVAFLMPLNPNVEEIMEVKTMLAEAVVNCMIHAYEGNEEGMITLHMKYEDKTVEILIQDEGCGIDDVDLAMQPLYTTKEHLERSGMGMTIMSTFADDFKVQSIPGKGTTISIRKTFHDNNENNG